MNIVKHSLLWAKALTKRKDTKYFILHHSGAKTGTVEGIHKYHKNSRGWSGIGYNFVIYKDGTIHEGRGLNYVGAHCTDYNSKSIGICCIGDYTKELMPEKQFNALKELLRYLHGIYPQAVVMGHREFANTACPGNHFPLEEMKDYAFESNKPIEKDVESVKRYKTLQDVPQSYSQTVKKYVDKGVIKGHGDGVLDLSEDMCRMLVYVDRIIEGVK